MIDVIRILFVNSFLLLWSWIAIAIAIILLSEGELFEECRRFHFAFEAHRAFKLWGRGNHIVGGSIFGIVGILANALATNPKFFYGQMGLPHLGIFINMTVCLWIAYVCAWVPGKRPTQRSLVQFVMYIITKSPVRRGLSGPVAVAISSVGWLLG